MKDKVDPGDATSRLLESLRGAKKGKPTKFGGRQGEHIISMLKLTLNTDL